MTRIKQIFLDLDGPLLDGKERHYYCYSKILERHRFTPIGIDEYWEKKRALLNRRDLLSLSGAEGIYEEFLASWLEMIESPDALALDKVQEGAVDCLRSWKAQGIELLLVTMRKNKAELDEQLDKLGLRPLLDKVLVCAHSEGGAGKANAARKSCDAGLAKEDMLWIGDTEIDWEAARLLGCHVALVANGLRGEEYLRALSGAWVVPSINSIKLAA